MERLCSEKSEMQTRLSPRSKSLQNFFLKLLTYELYISAFPNLKTSNQLLPLHFSAKHRKPATLANENNRQQSASHSAQERLSVSERNHLLNIGSEHAPETVIINLPSTVKLSCITRFVFKELAKRSRVVYYYLSRTSSSFHDIALFDARFFN